MALRVGLVKVARVNDKAMMKAELLKATETLIDMATESELTVLGQLIDLQLRKACFLRQDLSSMTGEQISQYHQVFIADQEHHVLGLMQMLNETDLKAVMLPFTQH